MAQFFDFELPAPDFGLHQSKAAETLMDDVSAHLCADKYLSVVNQVYLNDILCTGRMIRIHNIVREYAHENDDRASLKFAASIEAIVAHPLQAAVDFNHCQNAFDSMQRNLEEFLDYTSKTWHHALKVHLVCDFPRFMRNHCDLFLSVSKKYETAVQTEDIETQYALLESMARAQTKKMDCFTDFLEKILEYFTETYAWEPHRYINIDGKNLTRLFMQAAKTAHTGMPDISKQLFERHQAFAKAHHHQLAMLQK